MKRGEIWTAAGGSSYAGKPRPVVILQDDRFSENDSITVCPLTSDGTVAELFRVAIETTSDNGLVVTSRVMVDKITTLPRRNMGKRLGWLEVEAMLRIESAALLFLGLKRV